MKNYPFAKPKAFSYTHLDTEIEDPYRHLQELEAEDTQNIIQEENRHFLKDFGEESSSYQSIFSELKEKVKEEDSDVPEKIEYYYYYSRSLPEKEYELHCRKKDSLESPEEIYFDENEWAKDYNFFDLGSLELDSSQQKAIACIDSSGDEVYEAYFLELDKNTKRKLSLQSIASDIEWTNDSKAFYYLKLDESLRPYQCYRFSVETEESELIYEESDPEYFLGLSSSKNEHFIFIEAHGSISSEIHFLEAKDAKSKPVCFAKRQNSVEYYLGHHRDSWVILSNHELQNFALYTCPEKSFSRDSWTSILDSSEHKYISDFEVFDSHLVAYTRENAKDKVEFYFWDKKHWEELSLPEDCYHIESADNSNYKTDVFNYTYSSMTTNPRYLRYHFDSRDTECIKKYEVPKHYRESDYESLRVFVEVRDGQKVPVSILWNKNFPLEKAKAAYIYSYAAYGFSMDCGFDRKIISLCDRGIAFVQVHARGGSDLGRAWYEDGKFLKKKNTFFDVNDVSHWLIQNYPNLTDSLILSGGSAGGLLVGACINLEPKLYKLAILNVPFVDVLNTMLDTSQALTALEYDEWGNPNEEEYFKEIKSYSPYDNIQSEKYPIVLSLAAISDQRVRYWEALKYTQKLRSLAKNPEDIYLYINTSSGHTGASGRYEYLKEIAMEYNFILTKLNLPIEKDI